MRLGDRRRQRQPKPGSAARPRLVGSAEPLEGARQEVGREALTSVDDVELDLAVTVDRAEADRPRAVLEGVVDEIARAPARGGGGRR